MQGEGHGRDVGYEDTQERFGCGPRKHHLHSNRKESSPHCRHKSLPTCMPPTWCYSYIHLFFACVSICLCVCVQSLKYSFQTPDRLYLVTEYMRGGDLLFHLKREGVFTEGRTRFYGAEITLGIQHLHRLGVIHRKIAVGLVYNCFPVVLQNVGHSCRT